MAVSGIWLTTIHYGSGMVLEWDSVTRRLSLAVFKLRSSLSFGFDFVLNQWRRTAPRLLRMAGRGQCGLKALAQA